MAVIVIGLFAATRRLPRPRRDRLRAGRPSTGPGSSTDRPQQGGRPRPRGQRDRGAAKGRRRGASGRCSSSCTAAAARTGPSGNEAVFEGLASLAARAPVVAFPDGGDHSYWHDRDGGDWGRYVMREVIPAVVERFGDRPAPGRDRRHLDGRLRRLRPGAAPPAALLRRRRPLRRALVRGRRNRARAPSTTPPTSSATTSSGRSAATPTPSAGCGSGTTTATRTRSASTTKASSATCEAGDTDLSAHSWPGGHDGAYWNRHWPAYQRFYANALAHCLGRSRRGRAGGGAGPSFRGRRRSRSGSSGRPSPACRG